MIDLAEDDDQLEIAATAARVLAGSAGEDPWKQCAELGWLALALPESAGGVGYDITAQIVLFRELGRALSVGPFLATALAAHAVLEMGRPELVPELAGGAARAVWVEPAGQGRGHYWSDGSTVGWGLVRSTSGGVSLVAAADLTTLDTQPGVDPEHQLVTVGLGAGEALPTALADRVVNAAQLLLAAMLTGVAERVRDMSVQYATDRVQYGKPIATFQAVKHRCADMAVRAEAAWAATSLGSVEVQESLPAAAFDATAALTVAGSAALTNARDNIQNHGAIGFTEEHTAQRYLKRAHVLLTTFGTTAGRREGLLAAGSPW
ncbi:acyl-CoA dehydrogenase family protein [uncultured Jatrophihabitans sp.]|uniref:acyl-CoA dehydrogenase family protein n=1 Tax=uncultured Jatrophihabitans sp. TaxID=1610747 RepID=UPI0035CC85CF